MPITKFFLQKRIFTFILIALAIFTGVQSYRSLHVETLPQVTTPVVFVAIPLGGAAPEEIENLVTNPLEEKLSELDGVERMMSSCWQNVSLTVIFFNDNIDPKKGYDDLREKVAEARPSLPPEVLEPIIEQVSFENLPMMFLGITGKPETLGAKAAELKRELEKAPGVKKVNIVGATAERIEINLDQKKLQQYDVQTVLHMLIEKFGQINTDMPGGKVSSSVMENGARITKEKLVRTIGRLQSIEELNNIGLTLDKDENPVALKDIVIGATAVKKFPKPETIVHVNGKPGVTLGVLKKRGFGTLDVAAQIKDILKKPAYKDVLILNDASASIQREMGGLGIHSIYGTILVLIVLFLFLGFRVAVIVSTALPLSILMTFIAMAFQGMTIDMVSLFALVLALGMMVDNAIVVCENIYRHITLGKDSGTAALEATDEVGWPILSSTLCTLAAFLPMLMLGGPIGQFTRPIPYIVTFALVSSYIVALCFNPLLSSAFIKKAKQHKKKSRRWTTYVRRGYDAILNWSLNHRPIIILAAAAIFFSSLLLIPYVGIELFPQVDTSKLYIDVTTPTDYTVERTEAVVKNVEKALEGSGVVAKYISSSGSTGMRVEIDDNVFIGSNRARILVDLKDQSETGKLPKETIAGLRKILEKAVPPGTDVHFMEKVLGPPIGPPIDIRLSGNDLKDLGIAKTKVREKLLALGIPNDIIKDNYPSLIEEVKFRLKQPYAGALGLTTRDFGAVSFFTLTGYTIGDVRIKNEKYPVFLCIGDCNRSKPETELTSRIADTIKIPIPHTGPLPGGDAPATGGDEYKMEKLLEVFPDDIVEKVGCDEGAPEDCNKGYSAIEHEEGQRTVTVTATLPKEILATRIKDQIDKDLKDKKLVLPQNVTMKFVGETKIITEAFGDLKKAMILAMIGIYIVLLLEFKSTLQPLIILTCVPYALVGVVLGLLITHNSFGILSFIGVVCLTGIVVNNAIILIDYANLLRDRGVPIRQAVIEAAQTRLRPIIMTKSTVILGVLPLAIAASDKTQFWKPLCWSIIWGLVVATTLTLVIIPVVYNIMEDWRAAYYKKRENLKS